MITEDMAKRIVDRFINKSDPYWPDKPKMVVTAVEDHDMGWLISWTSSRYLETGAIADAIAGNGPILVARDTGFFEPLGSALPIEDRIEEAVHKLRIRAEREN